MKVANLNGCKVYNLSSSKAMPGWISQAQRKKLSKDEDWNRRLELIQDFEVTTAAQCITMTRDSEHILVAGTYPPVVRCFTTSDLTMKFQRGLTCEVVSMESLSDDYSKIVFLQSDRTIALHAAYGTHYSLRVPKFGRHLQYNWNNCDLYCCGAGDEIYRLNLEVGQFKEPFRTKFEGSNKMHINPVHQLLACGGEQGICEFWDPRSRSRASSINIFDQHGQSNDITAIKFDNDGLTMMLGTASGYVHMFDIRSRQPVYTKEHQYGLPIVDISFHHASKTVLTTDKKLVKIWERNEPNLGKVLTNIETPADINSVCIANDRRGETGLLMLAGEQGRIMTYFVPQLGPAPRWCSFLEGLTEELEETAKSSVYEDYKFVTRQELEELGATGLIGTPMLRGYMHGFFMEMKLYNKLRAVSKPFEYEEYRKKKIQERIEAKRASRISTVQRLPKINQDLAKKLLKKQTSKGGVDENTKKDAKELVDPRFRAVFEREEFQVDEDAEEYRMRNPVLKASAKQRRQDDSDDEGAGEDFDDYDQDDAADDDSDDGFYERADNSEDDYDPAAEDDEALLLSMRNKKNKHGKSGNDEDDEDYGEFALATKRAQMKRSRENDNEEHGEKRARKMFTLAEGVTANDVVFKGAREQRSMKRELKTLSKMTLNDRLQQQRKHGGDNRSDKQQRRFSGGNKFAGGGGGSKSSNFGSNGKKEKFNGKKGGFNINKINFEGKRPQRRK